MMSALSLNYYPSFIGKMLNTLTDIYYLHILINKENDYLASSHILVHMFLPFIIKWACMGVLGSVGNFWTRDCIPRGWVDTPLIKANGNRPIILLTSHLFYSERDEIITHSKRSTPCAFQNFKYRQVKLIIVIRPSGICDQPLATSTLSYHAF